ncbi:hypothetical protein HYPGJ_30738 [Hyphomicrobium sp. GJ21]|nr:hypothetical protein HYPGJ_30738 [Hyphomicrobium sp. GJ21]
MIRDIDDGTEGCVCNRDKRCLKLLIAIAAKRVEYITRQATGMNPHNGHRIRACMFATMDKYNNLVVGRLPSKSMSFKKKLATLKRNRKERFSAPSKGKGRSCRWIWLHLL